MTTSIWSHCASSEFRRPMHRYFFIITCTSSSSFVFILFRRQVESNRVPSRLSSIYFLSLIADCIDRLASHHQMIEISSVNWTINVGSSLIWDILTYLFIDLIRFCHTCHCACRFVSYLSRYFRLTPIYHWLDSLIMEIRRIKDNRFVVVRPA